MLAAKKIDSATTSRLRALARERTPAVVAAELAAQEAQFQREADWRKAESMRNVQKWIAARKAMGSHR
jgi:hypothetical protein